MSNIVDIGAPGDRMLHIIVNPASGNGAAGKAWYKFATEISLRGYDFEVRFHRGNAATQPNLPPSMPSAASKR